MTGLEGGWVAHALVFLAATAAVGQVCPQSSETGPSEPSEIRTLEGQLHFHNDIRQWFELKLDKPVCGTASIQLIQGEEAGTPVEVLRGCWVRSRGTLDFSPTGYYSLPMFQTVQAIEPVGQCARQPRFPDYSKARPDRRIRAYRVDMQVNYEAGDHPIVFRVTSAGKELRPWRAYARYWLTGSFVLYGTCGKGFVVDRVFGTPESHPAHFDSPRTSADMAMFDPEAAAETGKKDLRLGYTCVRQR